MPFPPRPTSQQDPWFGTRDTWDQSVETKIELEEEKGRWGTAPFFEPVIGEARTIGPASHGCGFGGFEAITQYTEELYAGFFRIEHRYQAENLYVPRLIQSGAPAPANGQTIRWVLFHADDSLGADKLIPGATIWKSAVVTLNAFALTFVALAITPDIILEPGVYGITTVTNSPSDYSWGVPVQMVGVTEGVAEVTVFGSVASLNARYISMNSGTSINPDNLSANINYHANSDYFPSATFTGRFIL